MKDWQKLVKYLAFAFAGVLIVGIVGVAFSLLRFVGFLFDLSEEKIGEERTVTVEEHVLGLEIELVATELELVEGEEFLVTTDLKHLSVKEKNGVLTIREKSAGAYRLGEGSVVLTVPKDAKLEEVTVETGAGKLSVTGLSTKELELELGAGEVVLTDVCAFETAQIDGGAGKLVVQNCAFSRLDLDMGVGELSCLARLTGKSQIDLGIGKAALTLKGERDDYCVHLNKGLGAAVADGKALSDGAVVGSGENTVEIQGGIGSFTLDFEEEQ